MHAVALRPVEDGEYSKLTSKLMSELHDTKAIGPDDDIEASGQAQTTLVLENIRAPDMMVDEFTAYSRSMRAMVGAIKERENLRQAAAEVCACV